MKIQGSTGAFLKGIKTRRKKNDLDQNSFSKRKRWEDNISEWTGLEFTKSQKAVENREKWRKLVVE